VVRIEFSTGLVGLLSGVDPVETFLLRLEEEEGLAEGEKSFLNDLGDLRLQLVGKGWKFPSEHTLGNRDLTFLTAFLTKLLGERHGGVLHSV
jgi:hypothetical protein